MSLDSAFNKSSTLQIILHVFRFNLFLFMGTNRPSNYLPTHWHSP
jgi:hypothetical protein